MKLSIIIISFNTSTLTIDSIKSIFSQSRIKDFEIIVLDNASLDNSVEAISNEFQDKVRLIVSKENHGFAKGNNIVAIEAIGEYLLLLNPDTVVLNGAIDKILAFAEKNPEAKIWGGKTVFADGSLNPASCWSRQTIWSLISQALGLNSLFRKSTLFNPEGIGSWNRAGVKQVDIVSGCFLLIKRDLWQKLNGFREEFFMYGEEADLCLRATKEFGAKPVVTSEATIIHYGGASEKIRADKMVRLLNAKKLLIINHFKKYQVQFGIFLLALWPFSRYIAHALLAHLGKISSLNKRDVWKEVWVRRSEWLGING